MTVFLIKENKIKQINDINNDVYKAVESKSAHVVGLENEEYLALKDSHFLWYPFNSFVRSLIDKAKEIKR